MVMNVDKKRLLMLPRQMQSNMSGDSLVNIYI